MRTSRDHQRAVVITGAEPSGDDQLRSRKQRYAVMMAIRVACLIGAVLTIHVFWPLTAAFVVGMVALPWCAVLIANDRPAKKKSTVERPMPGTEQLRELSSSAPHRTIDL